ncbi:hypothetical protein SAMN02745126_05014 [Enhydrobacter aerosaccus]|uniref:Uncharacterized protein n=1 Tax=Enhydrobacter aerosaccus TaxID=225324 RepID=A0A1T4SS74_9HYPH|nr:YeeE/YedE family protein [Enhydrobacter aerosaccus]SKA30731.1 hypothetical protein SAMN02745126_05014 [Enhydrobacter aerosaccus]
MAAFDPVAGLLGGVLIGLASVMLMVLTGRIAGISGIVAGVVSSSRGERSWRLAFLAGLVGAPLIIGVLGGSFEPPPMPSNWGLIVVSGLLVGFGSRLGGGCTSGHGVCGIARLSRRSIVATGLFMAAAMIVVAIMRHGMGG